MARSSLPCGHRCSGQARRQPAGDRWTRSRVAYEEAAKAAKDAEAHRRSYATGAVKMPHRVTSTRLSAARLDPKTALKTAQDQMNEKLKALEDRLTRVEARPDPRRTSSIAQRRRLTVARLMKDTGMLIAYERAVALPQWRRLIPPPANSCCGLPPVLAIISPYIYPYNDRLRAVYEDRTDRPLRRNRQSRGRSGDAEFWEALRNSIYAVCVSRSWCSCTLLALLVSYVPSASASLRTKIPARLPRWWSPPWPALPPGPARPGLQPVVRGDSTRSVPVESMAHPVLP